MQFSKNALACIGQGKTTWKRKRICKVKFIYIIAVFFPQIIFAQPFIDIGNYRYQHFPFVKYLGKEGSMMMNQFTGNLNLPVPLKNKEDIFLTGGTYDHIRFKNSEGLTGDLYALNAQLGLLKSWRGSNWKTLFVILPRLSADHLHFARGSYQLGGVVLFTYKKKDNLNYKVGMYCNKEFFGNFFMPLLGLEWKAGPRLNIFGVLPGNMNIEYRLYKKWFAGISYQSFTASYRIQQTDLFVRNGDRFWGKTS